MEINSKSNQKPNLKGIQVVKTNKRNIANQKVILKKAKVKQRMTSLSQLLGCITLLFP